MPQRFIIDVAYEWTRTYEVEADNYADAEVQAALLAKEELGEQFENGTPSMDEFDFEDATP